MLIYWEAIGPHRFKYNAISTFCGTYFYKSATDSMRYKSLRTKHIEKLLQIVFVILSLMIIAYGIAFIIPIYESILEHNRMTPLAINLPFFEKDSYKEYVTNMCIQLTMAAYSLFGTIAVEIGTCTINNAITLVPDLIRFNLLELQDEWHTNGVTTKLMAQLRNTLVQLQDYHRCGSFFSFFIKDLCDSVSTFL